VLPGTRPYRERLWPPAWLWPVAVAWPAMLGVAYGYATTALVGWLVGVGAAVLAVVGLVDWSPTLAVDASGLTAAGVHLPADCLGAAQVLDRAASRRVRGVDADARAFMVVRGWVGGAVVVDVTDPLDPTPYWYLSTRRPGELVAALDAVRAEG
jgi:Protein of unknown function (DUF3093)